MISEGDQANDSAACKRETLPRMRKSFHVAMDNTFDFTVAQEDEPQDVVLALFVVAFDHRKGNTIAWQHPKDIDLDGVEFKALPSGSHLVDDDFTYFSLGDGRFGLSCFKQVKDDTNPEVRGARAKSVGIVCSQYSSLVKHRLFLEQQVCSQLDQEDYSTLLAYFDGCLTPKNPGTEPEIAAILEAKQNSMLPNCEIHHPEGSFSDFISSMGISVFALWKLVLLRKRVLFLVKPPVGHACYTVYSTCLLGLQTVLPQDGYCIPLFYVNVFDIPKLATEKSYVACVTENVFEDKTQLYDMYVKNKSLRPSQDGGAMFNINSADRARFSRMKKCMNDEELSCPAENGTQPSEEQILMRFFLHLNNKLFSSLKAAQKSPDKFLSSREIARLGLHPKDDWLFISELARIYFPAVQVEPRMLRCF